MTTPDPHGHIRCLALIDAMADELRETLLAMREASGDPADGLHLEMLLREYCCVRDGRPIDDALIYALDLEALDLITEMTA